MEGLRPVSESTRAVFAASSSQGSQIPNDQMPQTVSSETTASTNRSSAADRSNTAASLTLAQASVHDFVDLLDERLIGACNDDGHVFDAPQ